MSNCHFKTSLLTNAANNLDKSTLDSSACFFNPSGIFTLSSVIEEGIGNNYINISDKNELLVSPEHKVYAKINDEEFGLIGVREVYGAVNLGKEVYFMDSDGKEIRVQEISKEDYSGKIYDVDVPNDVILVKRLGEDGYYSGEFWSGNSNNGSKKSMLCRTLLVILARRLALMEMAIMLT